MPTRHPHPARTLTALSAAALAACLTLGAAPAPLAAQDIVILKNGSELEGRIVQDTDTALVVEVEHPPGRVSLTYAELDLVNDISAGRIMELRRQATDLVAQAAALRGIAASGPIRRAFLSPPALEAVLAAEYERLAPVPADVLRHAFYGKLALALESPEVFRQRMRDLYAETRVARYDRAERTLYLSADELSAGGQAGPDAGLPTPARTARAAAAAPARASVEDRARLLHEILHALQDQNFELPDAAAQAPLIGDAAYAATATWEGDALLAALQYGAQELRLPLESLADPTLLFGLPPHLGRRSAATLSAFARDLAGIGSDAGLTFVETAWSLGGWRAVTRLYKDLPASTEQVLHPEKYFGPRDVPATVTLADLSGILPAEWTLGKPETLGEHQLGLILRETLEPAEAARAAAGWGGDALAVLKHKTTEAVLFVCYTTWDTEAEATEFMAAWRAGVPKRYARAGESSDNSATRYLADTVERQVLVERQGADVLVIEGVPRDRLEALRVRAWTSRAERGEAPRPAFTAAEVTATVEHWRAARAQARGAAPRVERAAGQTERGSYANPTLGYALTRPDDWQAEEGSAPDTAPLRLSPVGDSLGTNVTVACGRLEAPVPAALAALRLARRVQPWEALHLGESIASGPVTGAGGRAGYSITLRANHATARAALIVVRTVFVAGDRWYLLSFTTTEAAQAGPLRAVFERIQSSFKITE